jgi:hypothetical protein
MSVLFPQTRGWGLSALSEYVNAYLPFGHFILQAVNFLISFALISVLFAAIYKVLPDKEEWRDVLVGAVVTALLFSIGKFLIGLYIGSSAVASSYGAAGERIATSQKGLMPSSVGIRCPQEIPALIRPRINEPISKPVTNAWPAACRTAAENCPGQRHKRPASPIRSRQILPVVPLTEGNISRRTNRRPPSNTHPSREFVRRERVRVRGCSRTDVHTVKYPDRYIIRAAPSCGPRSGNSSTDAIRTKGG